MNSPWRRPVWVMGQQRAQGRRALPQWSEAQKRTSELHRTSSWASSPTSCHQLMVRKHACRHLDVAVDLLLHAVVVLAAGVLIILSRLVFESWTRASAARHMLPGRMHARPERNAGKLTSSADASRAGARADGGPPGGTARKSCRRSRSSGSSCFGRAVHGVSTCSRTSVPCTALPKPRRST